MFLISKKANDLTGPNHKVIGLATICIVFYIVCCLCRYCSILEGCFKVVHRIDFNCSLLISVLVPLSYLPILNHFLLVESWNLIHWWSGLCHAFSLTLTTKALYRCSLRWFETRSCKPTPRDLPSSSVQLRTLYIKVRSWPTWSICNRKTWIS